MGVPQEETGNVPHYGGGKVLRSQAGSESPLSASIWKLAIKEDTEIGITRALL